MSTVIRFDNFQVDLDSGQLHKRGVRINLRDQSFQVLTTLIERAGEVVTRDELRRQLWRDEVFIDFDNGLNTAVARLREALCDTADHPRYIETLPRRGYRFIAAVSKQNPWRPSFPADKPRLLVLPFTNLSGDPTQEYFSDAMMDDLITEIAGLAPERLSVIARTTSMRHKGSRKDIASIGRDLGVDYVIEGSLRRADDHVWVNVQLIQASDQSHLFAKKYEAEMSDLFRLERAIAESIVACIPGEKTAVPEVHRQARRQPTIDLSAYQLYLQGRHHMNNAETFCAAKELFEQAIARDPQFALAHNALGEFYWWTGFFGLRPPKEAFTAALWTTLRALEIDNSLAESHGLLAKLRHHVDFNWPEVQRELSRALELNPSSPVVRFYYATSAFIPHGRLAESAAELERALQLDPLSVLLHSWLGVVLWLSRDYENAMREAMQVAALEPNSYFAQIGIGNIHREAGRINEAIAAHRSAVELSRGAPQLLGWLGLDLGMGGYKEEARQVLQQLRATATQRYVSPSSFAWIYLGLGEIDETFFWMDRAVDERDPNINPIKTFPFLDPVRHDPRFAALLHKMNLEV